MVSYQNCANEHFILHLLVYLYILLLHGKSDIIKILFPHKTSGLHVYQDPHLDLIDKVKAYWETVFNPLTPRSNLNFSLLSTIQFL